jgi:hypothetical protein
MTNVLKIYAPILGWKAIVNAKENLQYQINLFNTSHCDFLHLDLENKKVFPYLGDI